MALKRIETINVAARSIMAGDMTRRIAVIGAGDEFDGLATNLNAMLERIEALMSGLREVSDNIAHDLKTPLTRLRNAAEAALRETGGEAYREGLEHTIEKADELIKTFNSLLLVARLEAGALEGNAERFDIGRAVRDVAELYEPVAEERGMALAMNVADGPEYTGNRQLVVQAVANLIENAIKYSAKPGDLRSGATIAIDLHDRPEAIEIAVADNGPGIAPEDRERVLKRFVRLEKSRTEPGTGLGPQPRAGGRAAARRRGAPGGQPSRAARGADASEARRIAKIGPQTRRARRQQWRHSKQQITARSSSASARRRIAREDARTLGAMAALKERAAAPTPRWPRSPLP